ncbi:hypothetical protein G9C98_003485 [Cotesia typhae]|uniref:Hepatocyte growth factor-regulated tyrosine kinase substrate helical domain-containing protein n=2 Tax=Cotesia typhae TaxID=2053667 RepID=A0A8J5QRK5_9HYME|nr:hypothetical protein G9C98_003485 [Cotesia typhae]
MPQRIVVAKQHNGDIDVHLDDFVSNLRSQVEIFVNRMKSNSSRGRSIVNDSFFQSLFMNITAMHSRLLKYIQEHDDTRVYYEGLQDKLAQVKDARAALDDLREEYRNKLRREAEEAERQKQMQMAMKLEIMRKKKQEYLNYQRQLALQKIQERERELQMRQEQQKQQYMMGGYQTVPNYMGPSQGSPIRHVQYQVPGTNYNPMSPTSQGVYSYGPSSMGPYPISNYSMPQMGSLPPHLMANMPATQDQPQSGPNESMIQQRENMAPASQPGMMPMTNVPSMTQIPGTGSHPMTLPGQHGPSAGHMPPRIGPQSTDISQAVPAGASQIGSSQAGMHGPPGHMGIPQAPSSAQIPQGIPQQMPQHVTAGSNIPPTQAPGSIQMPGGGGGGTNGASPQISQIQIPSQSIQYPASVVSTSVVPSAQTESRQNDVKKNDDNTAELISFD